MSNIKGLGLPSIGLAGNPLYPMQPLALKCEALTVNEHVHKSAREGHEDRYDRFHRRGFDPVPGLGYTWYGGGSGRTEGSGFSTSTWGESRPFN